MQGRWVPGVVVRQAETPHSYMVKGPSGHEYRRNRKHLRKVVESVPVPIYIDNTYGDPPPQAISANDPNDSPSIGSNQSSGGRIIRAPRRYQDNVRLVSECCIPHTL